MGCKEIIKPRLLSVEETAAYIGRSKNAVRELYWAGTLPVVKVGSRIHLDIRDLDQWIAQNKIRFTN